MWPRVMRTNSEGVITVKRGSTGGLPADTAAPPVPRVNTAGRGGLSATTVKRVNSAQRTEPRSAPAATRVNTAQPDPHPVPTVPRIPTADPEAQTVRTVPVVSIQHQWGRRVVLIK